MGNVFKLQNRDDRNIFIILLSLSLLSVIGVFPYILTIQGALLETIGQSIELIFAAQFIQSLILFSGTILFGLIFARRAGFKLPLLEAIVEKRNHQHILKDILGISICSGIAVAVALFGLDAIFTALGSGITTHQSYAPIWQTLLASFYGGIVEEVLMRLFLMSLFVWVGMKILKRKQPSQAGIMIPIFLAAIIFGLGHLPITASLTAVTTLVVVRAIILNGIGGVVFGWLFWKKGLESAMIAHFTTDIFLLTLLPSLFR
jgi:hypothetical protein